MNNNIYQEDSLQNDPNWKKYEYQANMNIHDYQMKNYGFIHSSPIDTDSMLRHSLIENHLLEEIDKTQYNFNSMPSAFQQSCEFKNIECAQKPEFTFWEATSASVNPQKHIQIFDYQGINTRHWGRKSDNFYKNLDDVQLKQLF